MSEDEAAGSVREDETAGNVREDEPGSNASEEADEANVEEIGDNVDLDITVDDTGEMGVGEEARLSLDGVEATWLIIVGGREKKLDPAFATE